MTPDQVYQRVHAITRKAGISVRQYCRDRGVDHSTVSKMRGKKKGSSLETTVNKLLGEPKRKC